MLNRNETGSSYVVHADLVLRPKGWAFFLHVDFIIRRLLAEFTVTESENDDVQQPDQYAQYCWGDGNSWHSIDTVVGIILAFQEIQEKCLFLIF